MRSEGHTVRERVSAPRPSEYVSEDELPTAFTWQNVNGTSYVTKSLNQHIPQYCGSCWAHGSLSALADRVKIARGAKGADVNLAVQYILNCGAEVAGSCHGGSHSGTYQFISDSGYVPFDTCLQYEACSAESSEGHCAGGDYSCTMENTCRTCSTFSSMGGFCSELDFFPNVTVADFGEVSGASDMQKEIFARGPIACVVNAEPLHKYTGGIYTEDTPGGSNHIISVVGWGDDAKAGPYWMCVELPFSLPLVHEARCIADSIVSRLSAACATAGASTGARWATSASAWAATCSRSRPTARGRRPLRGPSTTSAAMR